MASFRMKLRFGPFVLDSATRELLADGEPRGLTPKAFALLELLLEHRPRAVAKHEILERLWPGTFVSESNVASLVNEVREALGDDRRRPRYVRTVHRFGYAFSGAAAPSGRDASGLVFRVIADQQDFALQPGENVLGRGADAAVPIEHSSVSRRHAVVRIEAGQAMLEDCQSKNGTFVGGTRVTHPRALADCDEILLGRVRLLFRILGSDTTTTTAWPREP
jgi:DNA-binding winged helix-turn-helix (wHTH) protein